MNTVSVPTSCDAFDGRNKFLVYDPTMTKEICGSGSVRKEWTNLITFVKGIRQMHEGRLNRDKHKAQPQIFTDRASSC